MGMKFEYKGAIYDVPGQPKRDWKWMLDKDAYCEAGGVVCSAQCLGCVYSRMQGEGARKTFYYECFPEEKPEKKPSCEECTNYKPKGELPELTKEVFEREDCPEWAKWTFVDRGGIAWWAERKPYLGSIGLWETSGQCKRIPSTTAPFDASDWKNSLIEREIKVWPVSYKIIKEMSTPALERAIAPWLDDGWEPQGGVGFDSLNSLYMQAMIKKEE